MDEAFLNSDVLIYYLGQRYGAFIKRYEQATVDMKRVRLIFAPAADEYRLTTNVPRRTLAGDSPFFGEEE
jgi:hypothetical protein